MGLLSISDEMVYIHKSIAHEVKYCHGMVTIYTHKKFHLNVF